MICAVPLAHTPANATLAAMLFLRDLRCLTPLDRLRAFEARVKYEGGTFIMPSPGSAISSHLFELCLYDIAVYGTTAVGAVSNWMCAASRATIPLDVPDRPPFDAPRPHVGVIT